MGIDYVGAAIDIATEQAASFKIVQVWIVYEPSCIFNVDLFLIFALQVGLAFGDWILGTVEGIATSEVSGSWYLCVDNGLFSGCSGAVQYQKECEEDSQSWRAQERTFQVWLG